VEEALCSYHGMVDGGYCDPDSVLEVVEKIFYTNFKTFWKMICFLNDAEKVYGGSP
jgi:hypothetical protein